MAKLKASDNAQVWYHDVRFSLSPNHYEEGSAMADMIEHFRTTRKAEMEAMLRDAMGAQGRFIFQLECSIVPALGDEKEHENWHFQGFLKTTDKVRPRTLGSKYGVTLPGIHFGCASTAGVEALKSYVMKRDATHRAGPWADRRVVRPYEGEDLPAVWRPWQKHVIDEISGDVIDNRTINWVYDAKGKMGKTMVAKYITWKKLGKFMSFDSSANLRFQVIKAGAQAAYMFDLPRTKGKDAKMDDIYEALEHIKNGLVQSGKYEGGDLLMSSPHVWVFSNFPCNLSKMSADRFRLWTINDEFQLVRTQV